MQAECYLKVISLELLIMASVYLSAVCCQLLLLFGVGSAFDQIVYKPAESELSTDCPSGDALFDDQLLKALTTAHQRLRCLRTTRDSCADILYCNSSASSGYYQIQAVNGSQVEVYCDMEGTNCGGEGGWTRVAYLNMTDTSSQCPTNFSTETVNNTRFCIKNYEGCVALPPETFGITYSQVCGYARGYSFHTPDAFGLGTNEPVSGNYVDGVSITYDTPPRHVWTYAAGVQQNNSNYMYPSNTCPCNINNTVATVPSYVGNDYYCEAGVDIHPDGEWYTNDPLWDGQMCGGNERPCCSYTGLPWFKKVLPTRTSGSILMRLCTDQCTSDENIGLERFALFVK